TQRAVGRLARVLTRSPVERRRRNMVQPDQIPFTTGFPAGRAGLVYDSGDYPRLLDLALQELGDIPERSDDGRLVGFGVACCVESTGVGGGEPAEMRRNTGGW